MRKQIFIDVQKFKCYSSHPLKVKVLIFFKINNDMQKLSLQKLFTERNSPRNKVIDM